MKLALILFFSAITGCKNENFDIYRKFPKGSHLTVKIMQQSEAVIKIKGYTVLMYDLSEGSEEYNPHLLFYGSDKKLAAASYFLSENVYDCRNGSIISYKNDYRAERNHLYRGDVPDDIKLSYKEYASPEGWSRSFEGGAVIGIRYNSRTENVEFKIKNKSERLIDNPIHKITYDYEAQEIFINNTYDGMERVEESFTVEKAVLNKFFEAVLND